jgi:2,4-dienoyl-CoA reductase-like NADH-dependent reductase (Old Yellow Enzyme family)
MAGLKLVYEPFQIGRVTIPNRIVRSAHGTALSHGYMHDDLIAYHQARAKGGVGLSCIEMSAVHPSSVTPGGLISWDDSIIDGYRKLKRAVDPYGMVLFQQVAHSGHMYQGVDGLLYSSSATPNPITGAVPIPMSVDQIAELVESFAQTARRCEEGGIEGIELHAGHGYLFNQFLSPVVNRRQDEYGGSLENRMRFLREVLQVVRKTVSPGFPIGMRFSDEGTPGGIPPEECADIVRMLEEAGEIDFIHGSRGSYYAQKRMIATMEHPVGDMLSSSGKIVAGASRIPRILTAGRIRTLEEAEQLLRDNAGDLIVLNRALIADPDLVNKTRNGRIEEVRPCIACNQGCVGGEILRGRIGCAVNPVVGSELSLSEDLIKPSPFPKKVLVVGGGPAGLEAARTATLAGHRVTLVDAAPDLGGNINVAKLAPRLHTLADITMWLEREVYRLGVEVRSNTYLDADDVLAEGADVVIVATGSLPRMDGIQALFPGCTPAGVGLPHVVSSIDLLTRGLPSPAPRTAFVFDDVGGNEAFSTAQWLLEKGVAVTYATRFPSLAPTVDGWLRVDPALEWITKHDFRFLPRIQLLEIRPGECLIRPTQGQTVESVPADLVLLGLSPVPLRGLYDELRGKVPVLKIVGDANAPRDAQFAIQEGHMAGRFADRVSTQIWAAQ